MFTWCRICWAKFLFMTASNIQQLPPCLVHEQIEECSKGDPFAAVFGVGDRWHSKVTSSVPLKNTAFLSSVDNQVSPGASTAFVSQCRTQNIVCLGGPQLQRNLHECRPVHLKTLLTVEFGVSKARVQKCGKEWSFRGLISARAQ